MKWSGVIVAIAAIILGVVARRPGAGRVARPAQSGLRFTDVTSAMGIHFRHEEAELDARYKDVLPLLSLSGGVAVADFDGDGFMDIFLVNAKRGAKNQLYLNQGGKGFAEVAEEWGIADTNQEGATVAPVVFDYDNDGHPDVFLARMGCSMLFKNTGRGFVNVSAESGIADCQNSMSAVPVDFDGDGKLDLYVVRYWPAVDYFNLKTTSVFPENNFDAKNGGRNTLYRNLGNGTFQAMDDAIGGGDSHWGFDAAAADFFGDGTSRMYVANDFGQDVVYAVRPDGLQDETFRHLPVERRNGMNVSLVDLSGDGVPHLYVSNIFVPQYQQRGNFLWKPKKNDRAVDEAEARGIDRCGWAWGAAFADFDLDGLQDAYVANGYITGSGKGNYEFPAGIMKSLPGALMSDLGNWAKLGTKSLAGNEIGCLFLNSGDRFELASAEAGFHEAWDGRAAALIDFDNNGSEDLLVTTRNGPPHLFRNEVVPKKKWISILLRGTRSNRDGAGAVVRVSQGGRSWYRWATAGHTGFLATSDPRLHFGIPLEGKVDVTVRWPSGLVQALRALPTGQNYVVIVGESR